MKGLKNIIYWVLFIWNKERNWESRITVNGINVTNEIEISMTENTKSFKRIFLTIKRRYDEYFLGNSNPI